MTPGGIRQWLCQDQFEVHFGAFHVRRGGVDAFTGGRIIEGSLVGRWDAASIRVAVAIARFLLDWFL